MPVLPMPDDTTLLLSNNDTIQLELKINLLLATIQNLLNANIGKTESSETEHGQVSIYANLITIGCVEVESEVWAALVCLVACCKQTDTCNNGQLLQKSYC